MKIAMVGAGRIGSTLGRLWSAAGHDVTFSFSRDAAKLERLARETGARAAEAADAVADADAVILAVPWAAVEEALAATGPLAGKVLVDATNGGGDAKASGAEQIAASAPGAQVVKAINTVFAPVFPEAAVAPGRASMLFCGDDAGAKEIAAELLSDLGFEPVDAGPLTAARELEAMARLVINLAYRQGRGPFAYRFAPPAEL